jgi:Uncharacterized conserved protein
MSELFSLEDIFNVMIELETLGNIHYSKMKGMTSNAKLKVLFEQLAAAELSHKELYQTLKSKIINFNQEKVNQEYQEYMDVMLNQTIQFLHESSSVSDFEKGFEIAVRLEKDTILFLNELRSIVDANYYEAIDHVISQEQGHLKALYKFEKTIQ